MKLFNHMCDVHLPQPRHHSSESINNKASLEARVRGLAHWIFASQNHFLRHDATISTYTTVVLQEWVRELTHCNLDLEIIPAAWLYAYTTGRHLKCKFVSLLMATWISRLVKWACDRSRRVCCSVLQCVADALRWVAVCYSVLQCVLVCFSVLQFAELASLLQLRCSGLQCFAVC